MLTELQCIAIDRRNRILLHRTPSWWCRSKNTSTSWSAQFQASMMQSLSALSPTHMQHCKTKCHCYKIYF